MRSVLSREGFVRGYLRGQRVRYQVCKIERCIEYAKKRVPSMGILHNNGIDSSTSSLEVQREQQFMEQQAQQVQILKSCFWNQIKQMGFKV